MTTDLGQQVAQANVPAAMITRSAEEFGKLLPAHITPEKYTRWGLTVLRKGLADPKSAEAWDKVVATEAGRLSVLSALMDCASLGLEPGRTYHLIPYGGIVQGLVDYKGEIELLYNAERCSVVAMLVHEKDKVVMKGANIPPEHEADWFAPAASRGPVTGGYAYVDYGQGRYSLVVRMTEEEFLRHREKSKTAGRADSPWQEWPEAMRVKTLIHQLRKFASWSPERRWS